MTIGNGHRSLWYYCATACIVVSSFDTVSKYFGFIGTVLYTLIAGIAILISLRFVLPGLISKVSERQAVVFAILTFGFLAVVAVIGYPIANSGQFGGGTDIDDAMIIGVTELLSGNYPYYRTTYLGGPLSPMPGTMFLAAPFVILGILPLQNIFWLSALFFVSRHYLSSSVLALGLLWTVLLFSPTFYQVILTGSDHIANTIYVLLPMWILATGRTQKDQSTVVTVLSVVLLGVGLSSRSNFLLLLPLLFSSIYQMAGLYRAFLIVLPVLGIFLLVTIPFWLYDPAGFTPLLVQAGKIKSLESVIPFASLIIPGSALLLSFGLCLTRMSNSRLELFRNAAIVQLFALLSSSIPSAIAQNEFKFFMGTSGYGMFSFFFCVSAIWIFYLNDKNKAGQ